MKKNKKNKMINVDEKLTKNVKMKRIVKKRFLKEKENCDTIMFDVVDVKNSNAIIFIKYHVDNTTTTSSSFTKSFFEFKSFFKKRVRRRRRRKSRKKKFKKRREQELRKSEEEEDK